ncbi:MAG TPA: glycosyltransferase family 1 protein, partial [Candidatus Krumholzibacteria bacterium]|nr:glycosyltransferase family 1 protein [Candidatus Krumholzibacteria bacterium]
PCIVSDIPEIVETVGEAAVRVLPRDEGALAVALQELRKDPARRARLGTAAQQAVQRFSITAAAQSYSSVYQEILGTRHTPAARERGEAK